VDDKTDQSTPAQADESQTVPRTTDADQEKGASSAAITKGEEKRIGAVSDSKAQTATCTGKAPPEDYGKAKINRKKLINARMPRQPQVAQQEFEGQPGACRTEARQPPQWQENSASWKEEQVRYFMLEAARTLAVAHLLERSRRNIKPDIENDSQQHTQASPHPIGPSQPGSPWIKH